MRNRPGSPRPHLRSFLYDEIPRNGLRPFHLPVNRRSARWQAMGIATKSVWDGLPFNFGERRDSLIIRGMTATTEQDEGSTSAAERKLLIWRPVECPLMLYERRKSGHSARSCLCQQRTYV